MLSHFELTAVAGFPRQKAAHDVNLILVCRDSNSTSVSSGSLCLFLIGHGSRCPPARPWLGLYRVFLVLAASSKVLGLPGRLLPLFLSTGLDTYV